MPYTVAICLKNLCEKMPEIMPNYRHWKCPDPTMGILALIHSEGYVESLLPALDIMLGDNLKNTQWAGRIVIAIAVYDTVRDLGKEKSNATT